MDPTGLTQYMTYLATT